MRFIYDSNHSMKAKTLYQKLWDSHVVKNYASGSSLLYIDRHLVQEVSSPVAFSSLKTRGIGVRHPDKALAMIDHVLPTKNRQTVEDPNARRQIDALEQSVAASNIDYLAVDDDRQGIAHVVGPEQGFTVPGTTLVCGDSHTATHGAFGSLAFGIGSSECEKVLATQCLKQTYAKTMRIKFIGELSQEQLTYISAKDLALKVISTIGTSGGTGFAIEYSGDVIDQLSMEGRMTLCNMTIEAGARVGLIAPDQKTFDYIKDRPFAPKGERWWQAIEYWRTLKSDPDALFDKVVEINVRNMEPLVSWGTTPAQVVPIGSAIPEPEDAADEATRSAWQKAQNYMQVEAGTAIQGVTLDRVFIGSCTNSRIEDLRIAASIVKGRKVAENLEAIVVPGSGLVKKQAEAEGLDQIFIDAGLEWRTPGCSMCVAMNNDRLNAGERCASTSNRNFEGRQGPGGLTHLMSPAMAAAAAVTGKISDVRGLL